MFNTKHILFVFCLIFVSGFAQDGQQVGKPIDSCPSCTQDEQNNQLHARLSQLEHINNELNGQNKHLKDEILQTKAQLSIFQDENEKLKSQNKALEVKVEQFQRKAESCLENEQGNREQLIRYKNEVKNSQKKMDSLSKPRCDREFINSLTQMYRNTFNELTHPMQRYIHSMITRLHIEYSRVSKQISEFYRKNYKPTIDQYVLPHWNRIRRTFQKQYKVYSPTINRIYSQAKFSVQRLLNYTKVLFQRNYEKVISFVRSYKIPYPEETLAALFLLVGISVILMIGPFSIIRFFLKLLIGLIFQLVTLVIFIIFSPVIIPFQLLFKRSTRKDDVRRSQKYSSERATQKNKRDTSPSEINIQTPSESAKKKKKNL